MRVAVIGGTGLVGGHAVEILGDLGHEPVVVARSTGVDVVSGDGLDEALADVEAVVDATNSPAATRDEAEAFFGTATANMLAAEQRAGVGHHVLLSIVNVDRLGGNAHYAGKRRQESLVTDGPTPWTIVRAAQFFEFAEMVVSWTTHDGTAVVPPVLVQPLAAVDAARVLVEVATGPPQLTSMDVVGPEPQDLVDMARRALAAHGRSLHLRASWDDGPFSTEMAGNVMLTNADARVTPTTFETWLADGSAPAG